MRSTAVVLIAAGVIAAAAIARSTRLECRADAPRTVTHDDSLKGSVSAEQVAELRLYAANLANVQLAWHFEDVPLAYTYLGRCNPKHRGWEYDYLCALLQTNQRTFAGHEEGVIDVAFSPDGRRVASASYDGTIRVWPSSGEGEETILKGHDGYVCSIDFSSDGKVLASCGEEGALKVWDAATAKLIASVDVHDQGCSSLAIAPDDKTIACGSAMSGAIQILDKQTLKALRSFDVGSTGVNCLEFTADGRTLVSGDRTGRVIFWDVESGRRTQLIEAYNDEVIDLSLTEDRRRVATCARGTAPLAVWDVETGKRQFELDGHRSLNSSIQFSHDGSRLVTAGWDKVVRVWDANTGAQLQAFKGHTGDLFCARFSPDDALIASGSRDNTLKVWNAAKSHLPTTLNVRYEEKPLVTNSVAFSPDGRQLLSCGVDSADAMIWEVGNGKNQSKLTGLAGGAMTVAYSSDGLLIAAGSQNGIIAVWEAASGKRKFAIEAFPCNLPPFTSTVEPYSSLPPIERRYCVTSLAFSSDGSRLVAGSDDSTVKVYDTASGDELLCLDDRGADVCAVAFLANDSIVASCDDKGEVIAWNLDGKQKYEFALNGHQEQIAHCAWSPDETWLATCGTDDTIRIWNATSGQQLRVLTGHTDDVWSLAISPDGARLISASGDKTLKIWHTNAGEELLTLRGHDRDVWTAAFSPDGRRIASGSYDGTIRLWDATARGDRD
jgi:WD40 repeat protein